MHVMPDDDVFFIMAVKPEDMGLYSCTARNTAGTVSANATLTVLGEEQRTTLLFFSIFLFRSLRCLMHFLHSHARALFAPVVRSACDWSVRALQNASLYIFLFSTAVALLWVEGQRSQLWGQRRVGVGAGRLGTEALTEGCLLGTPHPPHPTPPPWWEAWRRPLQASPLSLYWPPCT